MLSDPLHIKRAKGDSKVTAIWKQMPLGVNRDKHGLQCAIYRRMKTFYDSVFFFLNEFLIILPTRIHICSWCNVVGQPGFCQNEAGITKSQITVCFTNRFYRLDISLKQKGIPTALEG